MTVSIEELDLLYRIPNSVPISAKDWLNIDELIDVMWEKLDMVRVYTRPRGKAPDYSAPVVLPRSKCSVEDFCNAIHVSRRLYLGHRLSLALILRMCSVRLRNRRDMSSSMVHPQSTVGVRKSV